MKKSIGSGRGSVYNILLKALQTGDKYGYEICKEVEEKTNGSYILKQPSLYSGLKRLEAQGDITSYWRDSALGGRRHYYSLTEKGRERINRSNFSWTDARDDIVDSLFEMSETDKQIENITSDIDNLKEVYAENQKEQEIIDEVMRKTDDLIAKNKQETETESEPETENVEYEQSKTDTQADDLFSIFTNFNFDSNDNQKTEEQENEQLVQEPEQEQNEPETVEEPEDVQKIEEIAEEDVNSNPFEETESVESTESNAAEPYTLFDVDFDAINQETLEDTEEKIEEETPIEKSPEENGQISLFSMIDEKPLENSEENANENQTEVEETEKQNNESFEYILSNLQTTPEEGKTSTLQKNEENVLNEYFNSHISFGGFSDSTQIEEPEQNFSIYDDNAFNSLFINSSDETEEKPRENIEAKEPEKAEPEISEQEVQKTEENIVEETIEELEAKEEKVESKSFDYRDIFGDLVSSGKDDEETKEVEVSTTPTSDEKEPTTVEQKQDDLPRIDASNDINRTLFFDSKIVDITNKTFESSSSSRSSDFERYDQTPFETDGKNPFEKYDSYVEPEKISTDNVASQQFVHSDYVPKVTEMAFDRKYANNSNSFDVPDYEVRYHKKPDTSKQSKFLSINKLNLIASSALFLFVYLFITLTLVLSMKNAKLPGFQIAVYVIGYIVGFAILLKDFIKYEINKTKKSFGLNKNEKLNNFAFAVVITLLSICINLIAGINFGKFACFSGGFMIPIYYAVALIIKFPIKKFLSGFGNFYN